MSSNRRASLAVNAARRSPRRRSKTPSVNELSKKYKSSPRGKRKLEFQYDKPLKGLTFYLDLQGYRKINTLKAQITDLGGKVEEFLSKDIGCVVTNRKHLDIRCSPRSNSTPSPILSIPSPIPGNMKSSSAKGSAVPSPLSADSGGPEQTGTAAPKHKERGKALAAQAAVTCKYGSSNVIANASNWGVKIDSLEDFLKKLEKFGSIENKQTSKPLVSGRTTKQGAKPKVRKLYAPFIKVEDHSRCYKPLVHELKEWPKIYFDGPVGGCPFDPPRNEADNSREERARYKRKQVQEDKNKKKGFCECCCIHYEDLDSHLLSDRHQSFARDPSNYRTLDELIKKGPSLQDFLTKIRQKHEQEEREKQDKNTGAELSSANESCVGPPEQKTPSKQGPPQYHTPDNTEDCHTPTNPSPEKTPSAQPSPEQPLDDNDTPKRGLPSRRKDIEGLKSDSSLKACTSQERNSPEKHPTAPKRNSVRHLSSPLKTNDDVAKKQILHVKTRSSTSSSSTANSIHNTGASVISPRPKTASFAQKDALGQSPTGIAVENKISQDPVKVAIVEDTDRDVKTRRSRQDSGEGGSKVDRDLERNEKGDFVDELTSSKLALRCEQQECEKESSRENMQIKTQSAGKENPVFELDQGSARRTSLRSMTKTSPAVEANTLKSPEAETKTCVAGEGMESGDETKLKTAEDVEASLAYQTVAVETKKSEHVTPASCTSVQTSVKLRLCESEEIEAAESTTVESTQENQELYQETRRTSPRLLAAERELTKEAAENESKQSSLNSPSYDVQVKLSDCRGICVSSNKPVLESSSAESETESIRLSPEENLPASKEAASRNATSEAEDEEISSTPTINCCPSSPNSEKSGYSNETGGGYRLRKRSKQQEEKENENISKRTRSNCNIPDEEQKVACPQTSVVSLFTSVKTKSLTEKSELFKGRGNKTPERKPRKINRKLKSPLHTTPRGKIIRQKDPASESDASTFSESPRSGPMRETRSMRASVRSLDTEQCAMEATVKPSALSERTLSMDHLSTLAPPIRDQVPAHNSGEGNFPQSSFSLKGQAAHGVARLFDSDDEGDEFYGFNVPQFDKSYSSEGEFSYQINTLVESINCGDTDRNHSDVHNAAVTGISEQNSKLETMKKIVDEGLKNTGSKEITRGEKVNEEISQTEYEDHEKQIKKRKSASDWVSSVTAKRGKSEGAYEGARFRATYMALSPVIDSGTSHNDADDDVDDDVFSAVSDSTNGEEEDAESPLSFSSWRQKRKSEDIQPELERPTKRRKSNLRWSDPENVPGPFSLTFTSESYPNCEIERVIEEKSKDVTESTGKTTICDEIAKGEDTGVAGFQPSMGCASVLNVEPTEYAVDGLGYDALLEQTNGGRCVSTTVDFSDLYYDDEPVIQTMEERVKLRRTRDNPLKSGQDSSSVENHDNDIDKSSRVTSSSTKRALLPLKPLKRVTATTRKDNLPLKPLKRASTSQATSQKVFLPLKPLQRTSSTQSSMGPSRARSTPSYTRPLLATPSGSTRRPTWIFDQDYFGSPPPGVPRFGAKSIRHSTPNSSKPKYTLRSRKRASWNLKQQDVFAFDE